MYLALRLRGENGSLWLGSAASCQRARRIGAGRFISHQIRAAFESMLWLSSSRWWRDTVYFSAARRMILFWISCVFFFFPPLVVCTITTDLLVPMGGKCRWRPLKMMSTNEKRCTWHGHCADAVSLLIVRSVFCYFFSWMLFVILVTYHYVVDSANKVLFYTQTPCMI